MPQSIFETRTHFDQLLMHGYVHGHPTRISVEQLRPDQRELLAEAVVRYLRAGFGDPGIGFFGQDVHDDICRRADLE